MKLYYLFSSFVNQNQVCIVLSCSISCHSDLPFYCKQKCRSISLAGTDHIVAIVTLSRSAEVAIVTLSRKSFRLITCLIHNPRSPHGAYIFLFSSFALYDSLFLFHCDSKSFFVIFKICCFNLILLL